MSVLMTPTQPAWQTTPGRWIDAACEYWLGWSLPPARRTVAESAWVVDSFDAYCCRCGGSLAEGEATSAGCSRCRGESLPVDRTVRLGAFTPPLDDWIRRIKYKRWHEMAAVLGELLGWQIKATGDFDAGRAVVVPMPMPWQRRLYRGVDHAASLARAVAHVLEAPTINLLRKSNGPPQVSLTATQRKNMPAARIQIRKRVGGWVLADLDVVLVDDVRTTGGSLRVAARAIRQLRPRRITAAVLAVTDDRDRMAGSHKQTDTPSPLEGKPTCPASLVASDQSASVGCPASQNVGRAS